jgi:hypothetical protein
MSIPTRYLLLNCFDLIIFQFRQSVKMAILMRQSDEKQILCIIPTAHFTGAPAKIDSTKPIYGPVSVAQENQISQKNALSCLDTSFMLPRGYRLTNSPSLFQSNQRRSAKIQPYPDVPGACKGRCILIV